MKLSFINYTLIAVTLIFTSINLSAENGFTGSIGIKTIYAKDENIQQNYFKPFAAFGWSDSLFEIKGNYYRWVSFAISDVQLNTKEINIHQPEIAVSLCPVDFIDIDLSYSYFSGEASFKGYRLFSGFTLNFSKADFTADYSFKKDQYDFTGIVEKKIQNINTELSISITDSASFDISYGFENIDYRTYGYLFSKHTARTGFVYLLSRRFFILGGVGTSIDSYDVASAMADAGFTVKIYDHIKLGAIYLFTEEFSRVTSSGSGSGSKSETTIKTESIHSGSFSVTLYF